MSFAVLADSVSVSNALVSENTVTFSSGSSISNSINFNFDVDYNSNTAQLGSITLNLLKVSGSANLVLPPSKILSIQNGSSVPFTFSLISLHL